MCACKVSGDVCVCSPGVSRHYITVCIRASTAPPQTARVPPIQVRMLLEDLTERRRGHRNVMDEQVEHAFEQMDVDGQGEVSKYDFLAYFSGKKLSNATILHFGGSGVDLQRQKSRKRSRSSHDALAGS